MSDYFKVADIHSSNIRLCFSATWFQLEYMLCVLLSLCLSLLLLFPPSFPHLPLPSLSLSLPCPPSLTLPLVVSLASLSSLCVSFTPALFKHTQWFSYACFHNETVLSFDIIMSPQGICISNQRWQRKCKPGVIKLERMHKCYLLCEEILISIAVLGCSVRKFFLNCISLKNPYSPRGDYWKSWGGECFSLSVTGAVLREDGMVQDSLLKRLLLSDCSDFQQGWMGREL